MHKGLRIVALSLFLAAAAARADGVFQASITLALPVVLPPVVVVSPGRQAPRSRRRLAAVGDRQASTFVVVVGVNVNGDGDGDVAGPGKLPSRLTAAAAKSP